jgi:hypothetical protein
MNVRHALQSSAKPTSIWFALIVSAVALSACGGGGSGAADATPAGVSSGTVTGFGSIVVDGIHYDDKKVVLGVDSPASAPDGAASGASIEIKLGHHVELTFTGDESNSSASTVAVSAEVVGKVSAITPDIVVAGQTVKVNANAAIGPVTFFEGLSSAADIKVGDRLEVHGAPIALGVIQATRIELRPALDAWLRISGTVASLTGNPGSFQLGGETINVDANTKVFPAGATLANGQRVAMWSNTPAVGSVVTASFIRIKKTLPGTNTDARVAGAITDCTGVCDASFKLGGIAINAASAEFINGAKTDLTNGKWVELRGTVDLTTGAITATRVTFRKVTAGSLEVSLKGAITDFVDSSHFKVRGVAVTTDSTTVTGASCTAPLAQGTLVSIGGTVSGLAVMAKTVDCLTSLEGLSIEGKGTIATIDPVAKTFTLGGTLFSKVSLSYSSAEFEKGTTAADLKVGALVELKGNVTSGVVTVTRIGLADVPVNPPVAGIVVLEAGGVASHVTMTNGAVSSFAIDGLTFAITTESTVRTLDGALVDGAEIHVLFKKVSGTNVVLLVNTKH